jgi:hypothetical protein
VQDFLFVFLVYPNNKYWSISNIFSEHLEFTSKKIILRKNYSRGIWTLCLHPQSYANGSFRKLHFILARLGWNLNILDRFSQNTQISNFINIRPESPSFSMQTDMKKPKVAFRSSANVSKSRSQLKKIIRFFRCVINKKNPSWNHKCQCVLHNWFTNRTNLVVGRGILRTQLYRTPVYFLQASTLTPQCRIYYSITLHTCTGPLQSSSTN